MTRKASFSILVLGMLLIISCKHPQWLIQDSQDNWTTTGNASWTFMDNEITGQVSGQSGFLVSRKIYSDFTMELEFYPDSTINSGVLIHCQHEQINPTNCYEVNIYDLHPIQKHRTGAIVTRVVARHHVNTIDRWNRYRITLQNDRLRVWLNGTLTADLPKADIPSGHIVLQATGTGTIRFRNIRIQQHL
ncbi:MAG: DUF1080 domain-containing protein [Saprospiraceae bacterium]|nr:DUF1080 domain-containing protein [Saprospiraceae bacterium]